MDLRASQGHAVILKVDNGFSKMCHFVSFKKLPIAWELASVFAREDFCLHGFPKEIASDHGRQFLSRF